MKASQIIDQLRAILPKYTDKFTNEITISSLTFSSGTVTAITSIAHNFATGDIVNIVGALSPNAINYFDIDPINNRIITFGVENPHDLTKGFQQTVNLSGFTQEIYNGDKELVDVIDRYKFKIKITDDPQLPSGTPLLNENIINQYNGRFEITVIDTTTFTYTITGNPASSATGSPIVKCKARITGAATIERAIEAYTKQNIDDYYIFVVLGGTTASRDRYIKSDASYRFERDQDYRQSLTQQFSIYVFVPTKEQIAAREARDDIEDIKYAIYKSIVGVFIDTGGSQENRDGITIVGDSEHEYTGAIYIHEFIFEITFDITFNDIVEPDDSVAFRDIKINYERENDDYIIKEDDIKLDT